MIQPERPLRRDAQANRQRVIEAAREVFAARGLAATLDDVAHHAGVGVGTVYRRFPSKEALAAVALDAQLEEHVAAIETTLSAPTGWDGLVRFLTRAADLHAVDRGVRDIALSADFGARYFDRIRDRIFPVVQQLVARAHDEGSLRRDVTAGDIPLLLTMISEVAHHGGRHARYLQLIIDGMRAGPATGDLGPPMTSADVDNLLRRWLPGSPQKT
ncbi:TetR/AcrR family transcriptional regulator [Catenuloplanes japonicus]|uniref:TetR/AcrR family transcriptional regulator n=1 Tax=Catenuloplanes japonicus TaxID=33876 RepID=UPI0005266262|nr:TetR/AcrR family transcriptional regulator [Catenuloplanes japonicus]